MNLKELYRIDEATVPLNDGEIAAIKKLASWVVAQSQTGFVPNEISVLAREISITLKKVGPQ